MTQVEDSQHTNVLLVEDNDDDAFIVCRGFSKSPFHGRVNLHRVRDGEEALDFLRKRGDFANSPTPDLVLLDLNMPVLDGRQLLEEVSADDSLRYLPIVVLTTSENKFDIRAAYGSGCNAYVSKPVTFDGLLQVLTSLCEFWLDVAKLPTR